MSQTNKRKLSEIELESMSLFDVLNLDAEESTFDLDKFAPSVNNPSTMELFRTINVNQIDFAHNFYDIKDGFPGGLKTTSQYNILAVLFPRCDDRVFQLSSLKGIDGNVDAAKWNEFMNYRTSRGPTKSSDGNNTRNTFAWMELAIYIPVDLVPDDCKEEHQAALDSLADESEGKFATKLGSSYFVRARVCKPFTVELMNILKSSSYCAMLDRRELPVVLLKHFIVQKLPSNGGYVFSSQSAGHNKSSVHLVGSIHLNNDFVPIQSQSVPAIANVH